MEGVLIWKGGREGGFWAEKGGIRYGNRTKITVKRTSDP